MTNVSAWSVTAGLNNASPPNGWPEGMARSAVNDTAREMMAALSKWYKDTLGTLITTNVAAAYSLATNSVHTSLSAIPLMAIKANATNGGAATLNVDGLGAKSLTKRGGVALAAGNFQTGQVYLIAYNLAADRFEIVSGGVNGDSFDAGTVSPFQQTAAPTGWVKNAVHDNKALRLVTGTASSGGATAFTSVFASRAIAQANLPPVNFFGSCADHNHNIVGSTGAMSANASHSHSYTNASGSNNTASTNPNHSFFDASGSSNTSSANIDHSHSISFVSGTSNQALGVTVGSGGSGTGMDFNVQYVDLILATKS